MCKTLPEIKLDEERLNQFVKATALKCINKSATPTSIQ